MRGSGEAEAEGGPLLAVATNAGDGNASDGNGGAVPVGVPSRLEPSDP